MLYAVTIAASSLLLFLVQPMIAKAILPHYGGSAGVWVTCMLFFQVVLLAGYLYSYWIVRLPRRLQIAIHLSLLSLSLWALPLRPRFELLHQRQSVCVDPLAAHGIGRATVFPAVHNQSASAIVASRTRRTISLPTCSRSRMPPRWPRYSLTLLRSSRFFPVSINSPAGRSPIWCLSCWQPSRPHAAPLPSVPRSGQNRIGPEKRPLLWIALSACASTLWLAVANHSKPTSRAHSISVGTPARSVPAQLHPLL